MLNFGKQAGIQQSLTVGRTISLTLRLTSKLIN